MGALSLFADMRWRAIGLVAVLAVATGYHFWAVVRAGNGGRAQVQAQWDAAKREKQIKDSADDAINQSANDYIEGQHAIALQRVAAELDATRGMLGQARDRGRRIEEAYRQFRADAAGRVPPGAAEVDRLLREVEGARAAVDSSHAEADAAAQRDALTLTHLQDEIRPWVIVE